MNKDAKLTTLYATICDLMRWAPATLMKLYEVRLFHHRIMPGARYSALFTFEQEITPEMVESLKAVGGPSPMTFARHEIEDGDIICFQRELSSAEYVCETGTRGSCSKR